MLMDVPTTTAAWARGAMLFSGLGTIHRAITTSSPEAQRYFDQGMSLMWGFNHDEATRSFAKAAQIGGAQIVRHNRVVDLKARPDGTWDVITAQGNIHAEHVVNCGGLWAREVGRMVGLELPVLAMEHMYLLTEDMPEVAGRQ